MILQKNNDYICMTAELNPDSAVLEAERIFNEHANIGYAWAPYPSIKNVERYGIWSGFIKPTVSNMGFHNEPPVIHNAPQAGKEDWIAVREGRRIRGR